LIVEGILYIPREAEKTTEKRRKKRESTLGPSPYYIRKALEAMATSSLIIPTRAATLISFPSKILHPLSFQTCQTV
jgi:hypothetical protein